MDYDIFDMTLGKFLKLNKDDKSSVYHKLMEDYKIYEAERKIVSAVLKKKLEESKGESEDLH